MANSRKILLTSIAVLGLATIAAAQQLSPADTGINYRQSGFKMMGVNMGKMAAMVKGEADFDAEAFQKNAAAIEGIGHAIANFGFAPESAKGDTLETEALEKIWSDSDGFGKEAQAFLTAAAELKTAAESGDMATIKPAFGALGKSCKSCHKGYRE